jgi:hypothetical protein
LIIDCRLLLELVLLIARAMPSLYRCLRGSIHPYFDAMTPMLMIAFSQSHSVPSDNMPCMPVGYHVHTGEVLKYCAPDNNQTIHRMISCQTLCQIELELRYLAMYLLQ